MSGLSLGNGLTIGGGGSLTIGTTPVLSGTSGYILYNNAGVLGNLGTTGTAGSVVLSNTPTLVAPILGTPTSATLTFATGLPLTTGVTGNLPVSNLNGGTGASASTFWRGDGTWAAADGSLTIGTTPVLSGTSGYILYNNAGVLGNLGTTGTAGSVVLSNTPTLVTPVLGAATGTSLALGGAIGSTANIRAATSITSAAVVSVDNAAQITPGAGFTSHYYRTVTAVAAGATGNSFVNHYNATQGTYSSTVVSQYGFSVSSSLTGATNNYGFYADLAASGTSRYNFFANGTAPNRFNGDLLIYGSTAIPAGGTAGSGYKFSSASNFGVFFGSGAPTLSAAKGSLYLRSDGSGVNDRMYVNTNGSTTWTAVVTVA